MCAVLSLGQATAFTLTQRACASALLAIDPAGPLFAHDGEPDTPGPDVVADQAFTASAQVIADTGVMGAGAAALLVGSGGGCDPVLGYAVRTRGQFCQVPRKPPEAGTEFQAIEY